MQISPIHNINPVFTSRDRCYAYNIKFNDSVCIDPGTKRLNSLYNRIENEMKPCSASDIIKSAKKIANKTGIDVQSVYETMGVLSQYSSYKSLQYIEKVLNEKNINVVSNLLPSFNHQGFIYQPALTNVMHYISIKNFDFGKDDLNFENLKKAVFLDNILFENLNKMPALAKDSIIKNNLKSYNHIPFYIENFENGYNFLNQKESFEDFTYKIIVKAQDLSRLNGKDLKENVHYLLNNKSLTNIKKFNIHPNIIKAPIKSTPQEIADNLNPIMPTKDEFFKTIKNISGKNAESMNFYINVLNKNIMPITPYEYCKSLKDLHSKISGYLAEHKKSPDDVYYVLPSNRKSYVIAAYQYFKVNNIKNPKVFHYNMYDVDKNGKYSSEYNYLSAFNKLPDNAVAVVLDDCAMTGLSYLQDQFPYRQICKSLPKDKSIIFAPIFSTKYSIERLNKLISNGKRKDNDAVIYSRIVPSITINENFLVGTSAIFPYMGADTNYSLLIKLYEQFFYSPKAQQTPMDF